MHIKDGLKGWCDSSPISQRTRSRVCQNKVLRCENGKEEWDLDDYERWESKERKEVKIVSNYRELGVMPLSPHANSKTMLLSGKRNVKSTKLQKKNRIKIVPLSDHQCQNQKSWNCHLFPEVLIP